MLRITMIPTLGAAGEQILADAQLLALIVSGESCALSEICCSYARFVFSIALKILNHEASAEEIVQQVLTKVWRHARHYRVEPGKFSSRVGTITHHQCVDKLRRRRVYPVTDSSDWKSLDQLVGNDQYMHDTFEQVRIREALQQIPTQQRMVIEFAFSAGMTHREIALHRHSSLGTVKICFRLGMQRWKLLLHESESLNEDIHDE